jgi:hypothetical protein
LGIGGVREVGECEDEEGERLEMREAELHGGLQGLVNLCGYLGWEDLI